jgi:hypothetical protein
MDSVKTAPTLLALASQARDYAAEILFNDKDQTEAELDALERLALEHAAHVLNAQRPALHRGGSSLVDAAHALCASRLYFGVHGDAEKRMLEDAAFAATAHEWRTRWIALCGALAVRDPDSENSGGSVQHMAALTKIAALLKGAGCTMAAQARVRELEAQIHAATDEWRVRWQSLCDALAVRDALSPDVDTPAQHAAALARINVLTGNTPECERLTRRITEEQARASAAEAQLANWRTRALEAELRARTAEGQLGQVAQLAEWKTRTAEAELRARTVEGQLGHATRALTEARSTVGAVFGSLSATIATLSKTEAS